MDSEAFPSPGELPPGSVPADPSALLQEVYHELRRLATQLMACERPGHTLQATELVHAAYLRLAGDPGRRWVDRAHFRIAAAEAMRRILIEHARRRGALKRGGGLPSIGSVLDLTTDEKIADAMALDDLLLRLERVDAQAAQVVRLRFYAGLSIDETAETIGIGPRSVDRHWAFARAWLARELRDSS